MYIHRCVFARPNGPIYKISYDLLCTSCFMDDVVSPGCSTLPVSTRSLGLGYKLCAVIPVASQRTHGTTFLALKVTCQTATPGAESAVYDCFVHLRFPLSRFKIILDLQQDRLTTVTYNVLRFLLGKYLISLCTNTISEKTILRFRKWIVPQEQTCVIRNIFFINYTSVVSRS